jgi:hypothetical protein
MQLKQTGKKESCKLSKMNNPSNQTKSIGEGNYKRLENSRPRCTIVSQIPNMIKTHGLISGLNSRDKHGETNR